MTVGRTSVNLISETPYVWRARRPGAEFRLICFPHGGGGASVFSEWATVLPPQIELAAIQLPGRQNRIAEPPAAGAVPLIKEVANALLPFLDGTVAFFGHSCGALLAFEVARFLQATRGRTPSRLFLSGQPSPKSFHARPKLHQLSHEDFRAEVLRLGGIDPEIAEELSILDALLPAVRSDFEIWEHHQVEPEPVLDVPLSIISGRADTRAPVDTLDGWSVHTKREFDIALYPGGHFYFLDNSTDVLSHIYDVLRVTNR